MATIKPIEGRSVHQIQSGQVIVDLCSVVKELVENSLDAGATNIEVRFKNQGLESIEVQDNGDGISPNNYETLALKHHTSKLSNYSDLTTLQTFGFRGEALSSLCALSHFSVVTCMAKDAPKGTKLDFEVSGKLKGTSVVAAQKGTTVVVENLFNNLPVRRRELEKKIKTEWNKVVGVLGQYACIQTGIKFSVTQQTSAKGKKTTLFSTKGNNTTRENIINVFGAKTLTALVPLDLNLDLEPTSAPSQRWSTQEDGGKKEIRVTGHISRPASGEGRQTPDRQMFFVNGRPCGLPQFAKAINEVYKSYNASQSPFIFANIELDTHLYDVNVSPDKRTIMLHEQTRMLENLKTSLTELFETQDYTVPISQLPAQRQPSYKQLTISRENSILAKSPQTPKAPQASAETTTSTGESEAGSRSTEADEDTGEEGSQRQHISKLKRSAVSRDSMNRDKETVSLISNWVGRKAEDRSNNQAPVIDHAKQHIEGLSKEKRRLVEKLTRESEEARDLVEPEDVDNITDSTQESLMTPTYKPSVPVIDFNKRLAEIREARGSTANDGASSPEIPIPALSHISPASSPAKTSIFSASANSHRLPPATATITIGDHTITSSIGTLGPKRQRIDNKPSQPHSEKIAADDLPSFGNRLTQRFSAEGPTHQSGLTENDEMDTEEQSVLRTAEDKEVSFDETPNVDSQDEQETTNDGEIRNESSEASSPNLAEDNDSQDGEYIDEETKKAREEAKVLEMIETAEAEAAQPSQENIARTKILLKGGAKKKDSTVQLIHVINATVQKIEIELKSLKATLNTYRDLVADIPEESSLDSVAAEEKLSLTISKTDFARMKIIGQFNLGFILASRVSSSQNDTSAGRTSADEMFIIDQHASDEKFNFERLQATTIIQSQRLVQPKTLNLTAVEEEIVSENLSALETNGFVVTFDSSGEAPVGERCQVISLPTSRETTFSLNDLNELISLLSDHPPGSIPRPSRARKMFAMRACRSSIMIGKTLTPKQMGSVVKHMGEIDKPWNCPHGRPTMRHLCGLASWDELGWKEGDGLAGEKAPSTDWAAYVRQTREKTDEESEPASEPEGDSGSEVSE